MCLFRGRFWFGRGFCLPTELPKQDQSGPRRRELSGLPTRNGRLIDPELLRETCLREPEPGPYRSDVNHGPEVMRFALCASMPIA